MPNTEEALLSLIEATKRYKNLLEDSTKVHSSNLQAFQSLKSIIKKMEIRNPHYYLINFFHKHAISHNIFDQNTDNNVKSWSKR